MKYFSFALVFFLLAIGCFDKNSSQKADESFNYKIKAPKYKKGTGTKVLIDGGHHNFHTYEGRFNPFAKLLEQDGYQLRGMQDTFSMEVLNSCDILVIANPLNAINAKGKWVLPNPSAFTDGEIKNVRDWVSAGGRLLLIADHMPFPGATFHLAKAFGFTFSNGFAMPLKRSTTKTIFSLKKGTLYENELTKGSNQEAAVTQVITFIGSAFKIPATAIPILSFPADYRSLEPNTAWQFHAKTPEVPLTKDWYQGAYLNYGKGKIVVYGEAAMMTAQFIRNSNRKVGFNHPKADQNAQFVLNTIHWLDK